MYLVEPEKTINGASVLYLGDAFELLRRVTPGVVDLVLTDPPYNVSVDNRFRTMKRKGIDFGEWDKGFDQERWLADAVKSLKLGGSIVIWNDWKNLGFIAAALEELGVTVKRQFVWRKTNPMPRNTARLPVQGHEVAVWGVKYRTKKIGGWTFNFEKTKEKPYLRGELHYPVQQAINPTKKPDGMFADLINLFSNPGDLVLDPFAGCGTTMVAATMTGRRALCIEQNRDYYEDAVKRWKKARHEIERDLG